MSIANRRGRHLTVHPMDIKPTNQCHIPSLGLESTADFFVDRLTSREQGMLEATLKTLDGKCIRLGSTCSGTDVIKPVMECTFRALNKRFNVPLEQIRLCFQEFGMQQLLGNKSLPETNIATEHVWLECSTSLAYFQGLQ